MQLQCVISDLTAELQEAQEAKADLQRTLGQLKNRAFRRYQFWKSRAEALEEYVEEISEEHWEQERHLLQRLAEMKETEAILRTELEAASDLGFR